MYSLYTSNNSNNDDSQHCHKLWTLIKLYYFRVVESTKMKFAVVMLVTVSMFMQPYLSFRPASFQQVHRSTRKSANALNVRKFVFISNA